jgi:hypothetical protein
MQGKIDQVGIPPLDPQAAAGLVDEGEWLVKPDRDPGMDS